MGNCWRFLALLQLIIAFFCFVSRSCCSACILKQLGLTSCSGGAQINKQEEKETISIFEILSNFQSDSNHTLNEKSANDEHWQI